MAIAFVQAKANSGGTTSLATAFTGNVVANNLLIVGIGAPDNGAVSQVTSITDTIGNVYIRANYIPHPTIGISVSVYYCVTKSSGANTVTVNLASNLGGIDVHILEYSGLLATQNDVLDKTSTGTTTGGTVCTAATRTSVTSAQLFYAFGDGGGTFTTPGTSYTSRLNPAGQGGSEDHIVAAPTTEGAAMTFGTSDNYCVAMATFSASLIPHSLDTTARITGSANPTTASYTCGATASVFVLGIVVGGSTARAGGAPTFGGVAMTQAGTSQKAVSSPETNVELWYLLNPPVGVAKTVSIPNTGALSLFCTAASFSAAPNRTSVLDVATGGNNTAVNPSVSVTTTQNGDAIFGVIGSGAQTWLSTARTGVLIADTDDGNFGDGAQYILQTAGAGSTAVGWTFATSEDYGICIVSLKETPFFPTATAATLPKATTSLSGTVAAAGTTGTAAATLKHLTTSLSGKLNETATAAATLPKLAASATGAFKTAGTAAATLKHLTASLSGAEINIDGPIAATLKAVAVSASGQNIRFTGVIVATQKHLTASASGTVKQIGTAAATLPRPLAVSANGSLKETGTAAVTLKHLTASASGSDISIDGAIAATLKHPTASVTGKLNESGTAAATLRKLSASATATQNETGTAAVTLKHSTASLSGSSVQFAGQITAGLRSLSAAATGKLNETGTASPVLSHVTVSAVGELSESGTIAATLRHATVSAAGTYAISGVAAAGLRRLSASATGELNETAVESATLPRVSVAATGKLNETGTAAATLKHITVLGSSQSVFSGNEQATLKPLAAGASGELNEAGAVAATLPKLSASAAGTATNPPTTGVGASTLKHTTVAGAGVLSETGTAALSLRHSAVNATGVIFAPPILGSGAITLPFLTVASRSTEVSIDVSITLAHDVSISAVTFHDSDTTVKVN